MKLVWKTLHNRKLLSFLYIYIVETSGDYYYGINIAQPIVIDEFFMLSRLGQFFLVKKIMEIKSFAGVACGILLLCSTSVSAGVVFYQDISVFNAVTNTSVIDFEGIVSDTGLSVAAEHVINGVSFTTDTAPTRNAWVCGKDRCGDGLDSAVFVAAGSAAAPANIIVDLTLTGSPLTAAGGIFGDIDGPAGQSGRFDVYNGSALLGTFDISFGDMGADLPKTFFGWTTTGADTITQIDFIADVAYSGLDDFQYGTVVPVPAAAWLFGSGLLGLMGFARRRH